MSTNDVINLFKQENNSLLTEEEFNKAVSLIKENNPGLTEEQVLRMAGQPALLELEELSIEKQPESEKENGERN